MLYLYRAVTQHIPSSSSYSSSSTIWCPQSSISYIYIISRGQFLELFSFIFHLSRVARLPNLSNTRDFKCLINLPTLFVLISHKTLHIYMHQLTAHIQTICAISCWGLCRRRYCLRLTTIFHIYICRKQLYWRQE